MKGQKAVSAYFTSKQVLPFGFAERCTMSCRGLCVEEADESSSVINSPVYLN